MRPLQYCLEDRREVPGRRIDDAEHLSGRGLLLQGLTRLGQEPRVLHRDHRLRSKAFEQSDVFVRKRLHLSANSDDLPEEHIALA